MSDETTTQRTRRQEHERNERVGLQPVPAQHFNVRVVGVTHAPGYPENILDLNAVIDEREFMLTKDDSIVREPLPIILIRNPQNPHDANAIEVHVPAIGAMVGHIPAPLAARLAPELDSGMEWSGSIAAIAIHPDHSQQPGMWLSLQREGKRDDYTG